MAAAGASDDFQAVKISLQEMSRRQGDHQINILHRLKLQVRWQFDDRQRNKTEVNPPIKQRGDVFLRHHF
jgi:hypothetical protein